MSEGILLRPEVGAIYGNQHGSNIGTKLGSLLDTSEKIEEGPNDCALTNLTLLLAK